MTKQGERETIRVEHACGGEGHLMKEFLINGEQLGEHCGLFSKITIEKGCTLGYHEHHQEMETYYILSGKGLYQENGNKYEVQAGDVVFCEDGDGHGVANVGDVDLEFIALILKK